MTGDVEVDSGEIGGREANMPLRADNCIVEWKCLYDGKQVLRAARHNKREISQELRPGGRIDPERVTANESLLMPDSAAGVVALHEQTIKEEGAKPWGAGTDRAGAVAIEVVVSLHPSAAVDRPTFYRDALRFWAGRLGGLSNVLSAEIHRDEAVEHLQILITPVRDAVKHGKPTKSLALRDLMGKEKLDAALRNAFEREVALRHGLKLPTRLTNEQRVEVSAVLLAGLEASSPDVALALVMPAIRASLKANVQAFVRAIGGDTDAMIADPAGATAALLLAVKNAVRPQFSDVSTGVQIEAEPQFHGQGGEHALTPPEANCHPCVGNFTGRGETGAFAVGEAIDCRAPDPLAKQHIPGAHAIDPETGELLPIDGKATAADTSASESAGHDVSRRLVRKGRAMVEADCPNVEWRHSANEAATQLARAPRLAGPNGDLWRVGFAAIDSETGRARQAGLNVDNARARTRATFERAERARAHGKTVDINALAARFGVPGVDGCIPAPAEAQAMAAAASQTPKVSKAATMSLMRRQRSLEARLAGSAEVSSGAC